MLTGKQKRYLRSLAVNERAIVLIGKEGLTHNVVVSCNQALEAHELLKVSVLKSCEDPIKEIAFDLASLTHSELVQVIGKTVVLYRRSKKGLIQV